MATWLVWPFVVAAVVSQAPDTCPTAHDAVLQARRHMAEPPTGLFGASEPTQQELQLIRRHAEADRLWARVRSGQCAEPVVCCAGVDPTQLAGGGGGAGLGSAAEPAASQFAVCLADGAAVAAAGGRRLGRLDMRLQRAVAAVGRAVEWTTLSDGRLVQSLVLHYVPDVGAEGGTAESCGGDGGATVHLVCGGGTGSSMAVLWAGQPGAAAALALPAWLRQQARGSRRGGGAVVVHVGLPWLCEPEALQQPDWLVRYERLLARPAAASAFGVGGGEANPTYGEISNEGAVRLLAGGLLADELRRPGAVFYDLGSGEGRMVLLAALLSGANSVGIELDPDRHGLVRRPRSPRRTAAQALRTALWLRTVAHGPSKPSLHPSPRASDCVGNGPARRQRDGRAGNRSGGRFGRLEAGRRLRTRCLLRRDRGLHAEHCLSTAAPRAVHHGGWPEASVGCE